MYFRNLHPFVTVHSWHDTLRPSKSLKDGKNDLTQRWVLRSTFGLILSWDDVTHSHRPHIVTLKFLSTRPILLLLFFCFRKIVLKEEDVRMKMSYFPFLTGSLKVGGKWCQSGTPICPEDFGIVIDAVGHGVWFWLYSVIRFRT